MINASKEDELMAGPSTGWQERVGADEADRFARYAEEFAALQARMSQQHGPGRALHRKQVLGLAARFEVLDGLPDHAAHGLFAVPTSHDAWVRLSNASWTVQDDAVPDVRGFAVKVHGVHGDGALGFGPIDVQDLVLINHQTFGLGTADAFAGITLAAARGRGALLGHLLRTSGVGGTLRAARNSPLAKPFSGYATEPFGSAAPIACGPYAAKVRLLPAASDPDPAAREDWAADVLRRLAGGPLVHDVQLQFFVDEQRTPIEDAAVPWPEDVAPFVTVARLHLQAPNGGSQGVDLGARIEQAVFDPWNGLAEHRPLGEVMRARKVVYFASEKARGALG